MDHPILQAIRDNIVVWMLVLFVGVLYWAFRGRWRRWRRGSGRNGG
jgi:cbb3-type cytochrome oxidase subunit 3